MRFLKALSFVLVLTLGCWRAMAATESDLLLRDSLRDLKVKQIYTLKDQNLAKARSGFETLFNTNGREGWCDDSGGGSAACWDQCGREGYSSSTCATRCGVSTSGGSQACWTQCGKEGYSSSTCSERCKVDSSGGSSACWAQCGREGYSSSTCATRCGVSTPGGSQACWTQCGKEGYSSSTCATRCGTN